MHKIFRVSILVLLLSAPLDGRADEPKPIDMRHVADLAIGMPLKDVKKLYPNLLYEVDIPSACVQTDQTKTGLSFLFLKGKLARIYIEGTAFQTPLHIGVGDTEARLIHAYGRALKQAVVMDEKVFYLLDQRGAGYGFQIDNGKVSMISIGFKKALELGEGCS